MSRLNNVNSFTFKDKIPGWIAPSIQVVSDTLMKVNSKRSQALVLNSQHQSIKQKISFGKARKKSCMETFSSDLKKMARDIMARNIEKYSTLTSQNQQTGSFDIDPSQNIDKNLDEKAYFENLAKS